MKGVTASVENRHLVRRVVTIHQVRLRRHDLLEPRGMTAAPGEGEQCGAQ